jgi:hypothetical protein
MTRIALMSLVAAMMFVTSASTGHAQTSPSVTYTYDARGRITSATYSGGVNNGVVITYSYDAAGNRTAYQASVPALFAVVPLNGLSLIILRP